LLSVVIPALNSASTISYTLSSIFSNEFPKELFEVLVIDNGSFDETIEIAKRYPVRIFRCPRRGIGPPRNLGIKMAKGSIVCFTDADCVVENKWLKKIFTFFKESPEIDGIGGPVLPYPFSQNNIQKLTGDIFMQEQMYPSDETLVKFGSLRGLLFGANSAYRKNALMSVGGFPEPGGSSLELCWKLVTKKFVLIFNPDIKVFHIFPPDLYSIFKQYFRWGTQLTSMQKRYQGNRETLKEITSFSYNIMRQILSLLTLRKINKKILRLNQALCFYLGRLSGLNDPSMDCVG
jgi:glycosyltransferase involved in cell wall biosynthesis